MFLVKLYGALSSLTGNCVKWTREEISCDYFFFFQAEDGIRDLTVTGVQTCALPISGDRFVAHTRSAARARCNAGGDRRTRAGAERSSLPHDPGGGARGSAGSGCGRDSWVRVGGPRLFRGRGSFPCADRCPRQKRCVTRGGCPRGGARVPRGQAGDPWLWPSAAPGR